MGNNETILGTAYVYYFRLTNKTKQFLKRYSHSLFGLTRPDRPEDLMIYRGKECFLAVCSHESYFLVNERLWSHFTHKNKK